MDQFADVDEDGLGEGLGLADVGIDGSALDIVGLMPPAERGVVVVRAGVADGFRNE